MPSERDLSQRFETSRGAIREAFTQLQQLGVLSIQPGGARVLSLESATMEVIGPLLRLWSNDAEDRASQLLDQVLEVLSLLIVPTAQKAVIAGSEEQIAEVCALVAKTAAAKSAAQQRIALRELGDGLVKASGHLVMQMMFNGLQRQLTVPRRVSDTNLLFPKDVLGPILRKMDDALLARDAPLMREAMETLIALLRKTAFLPPPATSHLSDV